MDRNFEAEITLYQISGHDDRGYGFIWDLVDESNYYAFDITDDGYYRIGKAVNGEWYDVIKWTTSDCINKELRGIISSKVHTSLRTTSAGRN